MQGPRFRVFGVSGFRILGLRGILGVYSHSDSPHLADLGVGGDKFLNIFPT